uniref:hypothetical protein n=1 Tax=unclassified Variovorax TaxID=663243 RepID=UPI00403A59E5
MASPSGRQSGALFACATLRHAAPQWLQTATRACVCAPSVGVPQHDQCSDMSGRACACLTHAAAAAPNHAMFIDHSRPEGHRVSKGAHQNGVEFARARINKA